MRYKPFILIVISVLISCLPKLENNKNRNSEKKSTKSYSNKNQLEKNQPQKIYLLEQASDSKEGREERLNILKAINKRALERGYEILFLKSDSIENILVDDPDFSGVVLHETESSLQLTDDSDKVETAPIIEVALAAVVAYAIGIKFISKKNIPVVSKNAKPFSLPKIKKISDTHIEGPRKTPSKKSPQATLVKEVKFQKQKLTAQTTLTRVHRINSPPDSMLRKLDGIELAPGVKNITNTQFNIVEVGKGGQGQVFKISFTDDAGKKWEVAAKKFGDRASYEKELRFLEQLKDDSGVVNIYKGADSNNTIFMEHLQQKTISPEEVQDLLPIVQRLHSKGIYHNDIKAGNVMFAEDGSIKLVDFGIATNKGEKHPPGTSIYSDRFDHSKRDIYSLGMMYFESAHINFLKAQMKGSGRKTTLNSYFWEIWDDLSDKKIGILASTDKTKEKFFQEIYDHLDKGASPMDHIAKKMIKGEYDDVQKVLEEISKL